MSHPAVDHIMQYFKSDHLPEKIRETSATCANLAQQMIRSLPDNPEKTVGLRKLLEAKDCFVRAKMAEEKPDQE